MRSLKEDQSPIVINVNFDKDKNGMLDSYTNCDYLHRNFTIF